MRIYIASSYTIGDTALNVRAQIKAAEYIISIGHTPYVSLLPHLWHLMSPHPYEYWTALDREWITACDALVRLPTGESEGVDREVELAQKSGRTVYYSLSEIPSAK